MKWTYGISLAFHQLLFMLIMYSAGYAQQAITSSGGTATSSGGLVSYVVGQVFYSTQTGSGGSVQQGILSSTIASSQPIITSFTPTSGAIGTSVTIVGTNFDMTPANNIVKFNGTVATISGIPTSMSIVATVPAGAATGKITVEVGGQVATSANDFIVTVDAVAPTVSSFSPADDATGVANNTSLVITFSESVQKGTGDIIIKQDDVITNTIAVSSASVVVSGNTVTISPGAFYNRAKVNVEMAAGVFKDLSDNNFAGIANATTWNFQITSPAAVINNFTPTSGPVNTQVTINGANFSNIQADNVIKFNGIITSASQTSDTQLIVTVPAGATTGKITVEVGGDVATSVDDFTVTVETPIDITPTTIDALPIPYSSFGSGEANYRIVAVPLNLAANKVSDVFDELMPYDDTRWRLFHYQNGSNAEMNANSTISPGQGYWLIVKSSATLASGSGTTVTAPFSVPLVAGWNHIGNPYNFKINWSDVQAATSGLPGLRKWINTMTDGTSLDIGEGGFVNVTAAGTLVFPAIPAGGRKNTENEIIQNALDDPNWQVYLNVDQGKLMNRIAGVGMNEKALEDYDTYDGLNMPNFWGTFLEVNQDKKLQETFLSKDIVNTQENYEWHFNVNTSEEENIITLSWDNSYFGENDKQLYLVDVNLQRSMDMRSVSEYAFDKNRSNSFKVLYGSQYYIKEKISVNELVLHQAWPNPATNELSISFSVPNTGKSEIVQIEMIDMVGKKVLINENQYDAGYHEVNWKRNKEVDGMYLITLKAGSVYKQTKVVYN